MTQDIKAVYVKTCLNEHAIKFYVAKDGNVRENVKRNMRDFRAWEWEYAFWTENGKTECMINSEFVTENKARGNNMPQVELIESIQGQIVSIYARIPYTGKFLTQCFTKLSQDVMELKASMEESMIE